MESGERQVAPTRDGIRRDHVARYEWAAARLPRMALVIDVACGVGYGSQLLAGSDAVVVGIDRDPEAIKYAQRHYAHPNVSFRVGDASRGVDAADEVVGGYSVAPFAVCFETIEHLQDPLPLLKALRGKAQMLFASVPNQDVFPFTGQAFHFRHYRRGEFAELLARAGWRVTEWWGQADSESEVERDVMGRTLIAVAVPGEVSTTEPKGVTLADPAGKHVAILGLGPSVRQFLELAKRMGGRRAYCDEVWGINALGEVFACDLIFHMDDVRVQEIRAKAQPASNIANMLRWLKTHRGPVVTSRVHPDYPGLAAFPLEDVVNDVPQGYFNSTAAYAVAYAVHRRVAKLSIFGMDFTYPDAHDAEKGRACVEFWLGVAAARGIKVEVPRTTTLLDAMYPMLGVERFYGYDTVELAFNREGERIRVGMTERATLPSAEEIEARYDHARHPNAIVEGDQ